MFADARIRAALHAMIRGIDAPPVPLPHIQRKLSQPQPSLRYTSRYLRLTIATVAVMAVLVVALPSISPALVQSIEARYRAALQAMGGIAPPPAPESLVSALSPQNATLATAQSRVRFTIVPPAGLPNDIASEKIQTTPTGVYSKITRSWRVGSPVVSFFYRRAGGRSFMLIADRFDPQSQLPSKYMFEAKDPAPDGRPVLVKHEMFAWRNGNQIMTVVEGRGISGSEIKAIRAAMHGVVLAQRGLHVPASGTSLKFLRITKP